MYMFSAFLPTGKICCLAAMVLCYYYIVDYLNSLYIYFCKNVNSMYTKMALKSYSKTEQEINLRKHRFNRKKMNSPILMLSLAKS